MSSTGLKAVAVIASAITVAACYYVASNYDAWFIYPSLRAHVNDTLNDPPSTQYRNERLNRFGWLCGELNAKNAMGGYVGFKRFIVRSAEEAHLEGYGRLRAARGEEGTIETIRRLDKLNELLREIRDAKGSLPAPGVLEQRVTDALFENNWWLNCSMSR